VLAAPEVKLSVYELFCAQLLKTLPVLQSQLDSLLEFEACLFTMLPFVTVCHLSYDLWRWIFSLFSGNV